MHSRYVAHALNRRRTCLPFTSPIAYCLFSFAHCPKITRGLAPAVCSEFAIERSLLDGHVPSIPASLCPGTLQ